jgi:hypothetical protein
MFDLLTAAVVLLVIAAILIHRWKRQETGHCYVSDAGNDTTGRRNDPSLPFRTIRAAIDAAQPGDTVHVLSDGPIKIHASGGEKISQLRFDVTSLGANAPKDDDAPQPDRPITLDLADAKDPGVVTHTALDRETTARLALRLHEAFSAACRYTPSSRDATSLLVDVDCWRHIYMGIQLVEQQRAVFVTLREQARRAREGFVIKPDCTVSVDGVRQAAALLADALRLLPLQRAKLNNDASVSLLLGQGPGSFGETRPATYRVVLVSMAPAKGVPVPNVVPSAVQVTRADGSAETVQLLDTPVVGAWDGRVLEKPLTIGPGDVLRVQTGAQEGTAPYRDFAYGPTVPPAHVALGGILDEIEPGADA